VGNVNAGGDPRVNIQTAGEEVLAAVNGIDAELAKAIVAHRGENKLERLADLFEVEAVKPPEPASEEQKQPMPGGIGADGTPGSQNRPQPKNESASQASGEKLVDEALLKRIADELTVIDEFNLPGVVNINTANARVLACLPGLNQELGDAIVAARKEKGFFQNVAMLFEVPGMTREIFKQVESRVSCRSETFRILGEGRVSSTGARKRIEIVVHIGDSDVNTLSYRDYL
jgi:DNA uptake protein ComE-like DNA-binding protein